MDPSSGETARRNGLQHVRRISNWTAAVLIAGTGTAAVALAHQASALRRRLGCHAPAAAGTAAGTTGTPPAAGPRVTHSVATTTASGVTVVTTTPTVNGKTVIIGVRHASAGRDN